MEHGGWLIRETAERIADYAELAASRAGRPGDGMDQAGRTVAAHTAGSRPPIHRPLLRGRYPDEILRMPGVADDVISDGDLAVISAPLDFYGVSFHHPTVVAAAHGNSFVRPFRSPWKTYPAFRSPIPDGRCSLHH